MLHHGQPWVPRWTRVQLGISINLDDTVPLVIDMYQIRKKKKTLSGLTDPPGLLEASHIECHTTCPSRGHGFAKQPDQTVDPPTSLVLLIQLQSGSDQLA